MIDHFDVIFEVAPPSPSAVKAIELGKKNYQALQDLTRGFLIIDTIFESFRASWGLLESLKTFKRGK